MTKNKSLPEASQAQPETPVLLPPSLQNSPFRSAYSPRFRVSMTFAGPGRTKQSFKDECNINIIMGRYLATGQLDHVNQRLPQFQDLESIDYQEAMLIVAESRSLFHELPSEIRARFANDPGRFLDFVHDPDNKAEMAEMGLLSPSAASELKAATPAAPPTPSIQPTPPAAKPQGSPQPLVPGDQA